MSSESFTAVSFPITRAELVGYGSNQEWSLPVFKFNDETGKIELDSDQKCIVQFVRGHKDNSMRRAGVLNEHVLQMLIDRQESLNAEVPSQVGAMIHEHLVTALALMQHRTIDRATRNVQFTGKS